MGDGSGRDRIVTAPANKATGYGLAAALGSAERVLGEAIQAASQALDVVTSIIDFWHRAQSAPVPSYVARAKRLWWSDVVPRDYMLAPVLLLDVEWFAKEAYALTRNSAFMDLADTEFAAWTNSSTSILIYPAFGQESDSSPVNDELAKIVLRHEANHVREFLLHGDRPPLSYHEMAVFETKAYTASLADLDKVATEKPALASEADFTDTKTFMGFLQKWFANAASLPPGPETDELIRQGMIHWKDHHGEQNPLLPDSAGPNPMNLYLR